MPVHSVLPPCVTLLRPGHALSVLPGVVRLLAGCLQQGGDPALFGVFGHPQLRQVLGVGLERPALGGRVQLLLGLPLAPGRFRDLLRHLRDAQTTAQPPGGIPGDVFSTPHPTISLRRAVDPGGLRTVELLALQPRQVALVAAHNDDLAAARSCGLRTVFIPRRTEHGPAQSTDLSAEQDWDTTAADLEELADRVARR